MLVLTALLRAEATEDEKAIREAYEQFVDAFNRHDAQAIAQLQDESYQIWEGGATGRAAAEKEYSSRFETQYGLKAQVLDEIGIVFVTPDVAIHKARVEVSSGETTKYLVADVYVKRDGHWFRSAVFSTAIEE
jgi:ketosteroid isomerase-like protein